MTKIFVSAVIDAPVEKVWAQVRDFNNMPDWHPKFSRSHIEDGLPSDRIGCVRNFDIAGGGGTIRERLLELSDIEYSFRYCILTSPLPVEGYVAQLTLYPVTVDNKTVAVWTAEFDVTNGDEAGVVKAVADDTFGKAFEVLNARLASSKR
ncbi:MAG: SRPBCC family protein [Betaproteobacteria bacterium]